MATDGSLTGFHWCDKVLVQQTKCHSKRSTKNTVGYCNLARISRKFTPTAISLISQSLSELDVMEVDDVEQNLLQQFSCMGTTDHDVLISQLRKLVGDDVNDTTASFFLDMNNWLVDQNFQSYDKTGSFMAFYF